MAAPSWPASRIIDCIRTQSCTIRAKNAITTIWNIIVAYEWDTRATSTNCLGSRGAGRNWPDSTATDYVGGYYAEPANWIGREEKKVMNIGRDSCKAGFPTTSGLLMPVRKINKNIQEQGESYVSMFHAFWEVGNQFWLLGRTQLVFTS